MIALCLVAAAPLSACAESGTKLDPVAEDAPAEVFPVPEGTITELFKFVEKIAQMEPEGQSEEDLIAHQSRFARTVVAVVDKVLGMKPNDQEALQSHYFKMEALQMLFELEDPSAAEKLEQAISVARASKLPDVASLGLSFWIETRLSKWRTLGEQQKTDFVDAIVEGMAGYEQVDVDQVRLITTVAGQLDNLESPKLALLLIDRVLPRFQSSEDGKVKQSVAQLEGAARWMNLMGNKMDLKGTLLDGKSLDWESYRGKVVLVDFWATWCGPCRSEVPNILKQYQAYHDKGFEVLGISLDQDSEQAEAYISQANIPWPTLFSKNERQRGWKHPMAIYYNVNAIPRAILCDREGRVVSMNARGQRLALELRKLLGEPVARANSSGKNLVDHESALVGRE